MKNSELKTQAKGIIKESKPSIISGALLYILIITVLSYLSTKLVGLNMSDNDLQKYADMYANGQFEQAASLLTKYVPEKLAMLIDTLINLVEIVLAGGFTIFIMQSVRKTGEACYGNLLDGFSIAGRLILLSILEGLVIFFLCLLLIVPGIIMSYAYRQAEYLLIDHPDWSVTECMKKSRQMMKGHKGELFSLDLSFLGWYILGLVPIVDIWVQPYTRTTYMLFYEHLLDRPFEPQQEQQTQQL